MSRSTTELQGMAATATSASASPELFARLTHALAGLCRGGTVVAGPDAARVADALRAEGIARTTSLSMDAGGAAAALAALPAESCRSVLLAELLPGDDAAATSIAAAAYAAVKPGGRLVVLVPHARAVDAPGARKRRELERLLASLGRAKLAVEQPYRWLVMYVKKHGSGEAHVPPLVAERYRLIAGLCRGSVLELGCGPGHLAAGIARAGHEVTGVDLNGPKIAEARARYPHLTFYQADAAEIRETARFGTVVIAEVLEHVDAATGDRILATAARALAPRGRLIVSVPNEKCIPHPNHVRLFDERTLRELLRPFGAPRKVIDQPFKWLMMYVDQD